MSRPEREDEERLRGIWDVEERMDWILGTREGEGWIDEA